MATIGFKLHEMMSNARDYSRGYLFYVIIAGRYVSEANSKYFVRGTNLPASSVEPTTASWQGNAYKLGTTQTFEDWTCSFNVDIEDNLRHNFLLWTEQIHNASSNIHGAPEADSAGAGYMADIFIQHIDQFDGKVITEYRLIGAWPSNIGQMALAYESKEIAQFDVTFTYQYHTTGDGDGASPEGGGTNQSIS